MFAVLSRTFGRDNYNLQLKRRGVIGPELPTSVESVKRDEYHDGDRNHGLREENTRGEKRRRENRRRKLETGEENAKRDEEEKSRNNCTAQSREMVRKVTWSSFWSFDRR